MQQEVDFIIVGQGIGGTLLSYELMQLGATVKIIDALNYQSASWISGAAIHPISKKHFTTDQARIDRFDYAIQAYNGLSKLIDYDMFTKESLFYFFKDGVEEETFNDSSNNYEHLKIVSKQEANSIETYFNTPYNFGKIQPVIQINAVALLTAYRNYLLAHHQLLEETFDFNELKVLENGIKYKDIKAQKIIFATGVSQKLQPYFNQLPFTENRGECLLVNIPDLPQSAIYHGPTRLIPRGGTQFWCGSNYIWEASERLPNPQWRKTQFELLNDWIKVPFEIISHQFAARPTAAGQTPFIGLHPEMKSIGIFNGLGTKGFTDGPYWAHQFAIQLTQSSEEDTFQLYLNKKLS